MNTVYSEYAEYLVYPDYTVVYIEKANFKH